MELLIMDISEACQTIQAMARHHEAVMVLAKAVENVGVLENTTRELEKRVASLRAEGYDLRTLGKRVQALQHEIETLEKRRDKIRAAVRAAVGDEAIADIPAA